MAYIVTRMVEWGDYDEAGIVFYPNYFRWMDGAFHQVCQSQKHTRRSMSQHFSIHGYPLPDA